MIASGRGQRMTRADAVIGAIVAAMALVVTGCASVAPTPEQLRARSYEETDAVAVQPVVVAEPPELSAVPEIDSSDAGVALDAARFCNPAALKGVDCIATYRTARDYVRSRYAADRQRTIALLEGRRVGNRIDWADAAVILGGSPYVFSRRALVTTSPAPAAGARSRTRRSQPVAASRPSYGGSCPCGTGAICIGPRGGRYCITSGGNKRYGV